MAPANETPRDFEAPAQIASAHDAKQILPVQHQRVFNFFLAFEHPHINALTILCNARVGAV